MKGKREADNNFNFKSEKLDELRSRVDAAFDEHGDETARLSGLLFHSAVAQERMAAALRR